MHCTFYCRYSVHLHRFVYVSPPHCLSSPQVCLFMTPIKVVCRCFLTAAVNVRVVYHCNCVCLTPPPLSSPGFLISVFVCVLLTPACLSHWPCSSALMRLSPPIYFYHRDCICSPHHLFNTSPMFTTTTKVLYHHLSLSRLLCLYISRRVFIITPGFGYQSVHLRGWAAFRAMNDT